VDRSSAGWRTPDDDRAERLAKAWIGRLVERTPVGELGDLPLGRLGAEAPPLIASVLDAVSDPGRGPGELAIAAGRLADLFDEKPVVTGRPGSETDRTVRTDPRPHGGLPGPRDLERCLAALLAEHRRYGHPFSVALVDVDGLGRINAAHGRRAGDLMLAGVAGVLRRQLREVDRAFRATEDEFAVVAPHTKADDLVPMARRVANLIAGAQSGDGPRIAIATGVVSCPADGLAPERLLESATEAIYAAKASGAAVASSANGTVLQDS
jgi:diguanylate cyclase (GGDEF)-like protein